MVSDGGRTEDQRNRPFAERVFGRVVGSMVSPVVDNVDVDEVVERIDVNHLVERIDLDELIERIDVDRLMGRVDIDALLARVDINDLLERIDVDRLLARIDVNSLLDRVEPDRLIDRIDVNAVIGRVGVDAMIDRVDMNAVIGRVDVDAMIDRVDADRLLARVDVNAMIEQVDVNAVIGRVDVNAMIGRVDVDGVIDRVDVDLLMSRVDVNAVVERTELGAIIARSTSGVFGQLLDVARTQLIGVDQVVQAVPARLLRGQVREVPYMPSGPSPIGDLQAMSLSQRAVAFQRHAAGSVSRFLAFLIDQFIAGILFSGGLVLTAAALRVVIGVDLDIEGDSTLIALAYVSWLFLYVAGSLAATGRTIGKAVLGLMVVEADGQKLTGWAPVVRTIVFPISFLLFGLGLILGLFRHDRRELHDLIAGTAVIYAWDAATAQLRAEAGEPS
ncbi:MAG: RDD family protein [Acidimicrobiia bacterium]|nr:RDD family protein [Acidimicrobiia bacterium]